MERQAPNQCPVCGGATHVKVVACSSCGSEIHGVFSQSPISGLDADQMKFLETFLRCRGVLSSMERELGISYPTVRSRLDALLNALGYGGAPDRREEIAEKQRRILERLEAGEITADEARQELQGAR